MKMKKWLSVALACSAVVLGACGGQGQTQGDPDHGGTARSLLLRTLLSAVEPPRGGHHAGPGAECHDVGRSRHLRWLGQLSRGSAGL